MSSKYCYMYMADFLDFSTANQTCENINGNLAVLDDENENMKIAKWLHHICGMLLADFLRYTIEFVQIKVE